MQTTVNLSSFINAPTMQPATESAEPVMPPLPPKNSFTVWFTANPFAQTFGHFAIALAIAIIEFILCYYVIEPSLTGFFPLSSFITDILFLIILVLGARIVIDRQINKRNGLQMMSNFVGALQSAIIARESSTALNEQEWTELSWIPVQYLLCLRYKSKSNTSVTDTPNDFRSEFNRLGYEVRIARIGQWCRARGINFSRCLEIYENAAVGERFILTRDMNGFTWVCAWLYCLLVPFVLWGFYDVVVACIGLLSVWAVLALAHGFNRNMHFYDLYRKHVLTPFDLMSYAVEQSKIITALKSV